MKCYCLILILLSNLCYSQSNFEKTIQAGGVIINGLSFIKSNKSSSNTNKTILMLCVKNKLEEKIIFKITGKDKEGNEIKKDLVIQNDGKECFIEISKGIYTYEVILSNKDTFKKGEYKFDDDIIVTIKKDN